MRWLIAAALLLLPTPAAAWWDYAHRTIAGIAWLEARPATRAEMRRLLAHSASLGTPGCPANRIESASVWADCIKRLGDRFRHADAWHYQNVDICRPFDLAAACRDGNCVSAQIERQLRQLRDRRLPARERLTALAFLIHLVGDLHMPLHAGDRSDRGGSDFRAAYGLIDSNLHLIWDGYLPERALSTPMAGPRGLLREISADDRVEATAGTVEDWSRQSWALARYAYATLLGDPCAGVPAEPPTISEARMQVMIPVIRRHVAYAGLRLARLLDEALG